MKTRTMGRALALVCGAALLALPALAQQDAGGPPPGQTGERGPGGQMRGMMRDLNLTPDQEKQAREIFEAQRSRMEALRDNSSLSQEDRRAEMRKIHEEGMQKLRAILTDEQKAKLDEMEKRQREHMREEHRDQGGDQGTMPPPPPPPAQ